MGGIGYHRLFKQKSSICPIIIPLLFHDSPIDNHYSSMIILSFALVNLQNYEKIKHFKQM